MSPRVFDLKLPGSDLRISVRAIVNYDRGHRVTILEIDGVTVGPDDLTKPFRRWLVDQLIRAEMVIRAIGTVDCPHGSYLVADFCAKCIGCASPYP